MKVTSRTYFARAAWASCASLLVVGLLMNGLAQQANAQVATWTNGGGAGTGDFYDGANWDTGTAPGATNIALIDGGGTAIINAAGTGAGANVGSLQSGSVVSGSGSFQIDSGFLTSDTTASIAASGMATGSLVMNGGILHIGDVPGLVGLQASTGSEDLVFSNSADTNSSLELHNDAQLRGVDDLILGNHNLSGPVGSGATSVASLVMDGNSSLSFADGFGTRGQLTINMSGNSEASFGNSLGPANPAGLHKIEGGFVNLGSRFGSQADIVLEDNAIFNAKRLQNNQGTSTITVRGNAQFNVFNVGAGGTETDFKGQAYLSRQSHSTNGLSSTVITLEGSGRFSVDVDPDTINVAGDDGHVDFLNQSGLTLAGGDDEPVDIGTGNDYNGGIVVVDIKDSSEFNIVQDLWMTYGKGSTASSTVKVTGPAATISIGEDLNMAVAIDQQLTGNTQTGTVTVNGFLDRPGTAALHSVITGSTHSIIQVGDEARIGNGDLIVELDGYSPVLGDSYTLIQTGNSAGVLGEFSSTDLSLAPLDAGLGWSLDYFADSVVLSVVPEPSSMLLAFAAVACMLGKSRSSRS